MEWIIAGALFILLSVWAWVELRSRSATATARFQIAVNDAGIVVIDEFGQRNELAWDTLDRVDIRTTDDGPMGADLFWGLHGAGKGVMVFPGGALGKQDLISALGFRLPGFDHEALLRAMGSTSHALFTLWDRHSPTQAAVH